MIYVDVLPFIIKHCFIQMLRSKIKCFTFYAALLLPYRLNPFGTIIPCWHLSEANFLKSMSSPFKLQFFFSQVRDSPSDESRSLYVGNIIPKSLKQTVFLENTNGYKSCSPTRPVRTCLFYSIC